MVIESSNYLNRIDNRQFDLFSQRLHNSINKAVSQFKGKVVLLKSNSYLVSFKNVDDAISCALTVKRKAKYVTPNFDPSYKQLQIGISAGVPVTNNKQLFEEAQNLATHLCEVVSGDIVISSEIRELYNRAHRHAKLDPESIRVLTKREEHFLKKLMHYVEMHWNSPQFNVTDFSEKMGYSKSQLNRNIKSLTGYSPNNFVKHLRLQRALKMLHTQQGNISEIAFEAGFNTPAYFSKCFADEFGLLPSTYMQQHKD